MGDDVTQAYTRKQDLLTRRIAGESIVVPIRGKLADLQRVFALDPVGEFVWERLGGRRTVAELAAAVAVEFDVEPAEAEGDIREFVASLLEAGLIEDVKP
jgi:hypothetical protein